MASPIRRNDIVRVFGTPDVTEGSVNEPREREENGMRFNERWYYKRPRNDPARAYERVIYWHRYDYVGSCIRRTPDGPWEPDPSLPERVRAAA